MRHPDLWRPEAYRSISRYQWVDFLRGVGCLLVIFHHSQIPVLGWFWWVLDLFFVTSGALITRIMLQIRDHDRPLMEFFVFRAGRLLPAMVLFYLGLVLATPVLGLDTKIADLLPYVLMYQNTDFYLLDGAQLPRVRVLGHFWSLIVEEHFYLLWGVFGLLYLLPKINYTRLFIIAALLLAFAMTARIAGLHMWTLVARLDSFVVGSLMGVLIFADVALPPAIAARKKTIYKVYLGAVALSFLWALRGIYVFIVTPDYGDFGVSPWFDVLPNAILCSYIVLWMLHLDAVRRKMSVLSKSFAWFGVISYEAYLFHFPYYFGLRKFGSVEFRSQHLLQFVIVLGATMVTAYLVNRYVTRPVMKRRQLLYDIVNRLIPARTA
ncbi:MAG: acyltransferase [Parvularculaceae bacterium]